MQSLIQHFRAHPDGREAATERFLRGGEWLDLPTDWRLRLCETDGPLAQMPGIIDGSARVCACELPFYTRKPVLLLRVQHADATRYGLLTERGFRPLDGSSTPIHDVSHEAGPHLHEENVFDYLKFFCYFVHGDLGPFLIIETIDDVPQAGSLPPDMLGQLETRLTGWSCRGVSHDAKYVLDVCLLYSGELARCTMHVYPTEIVL